MIYSIISCIKFLFRNQVQNEKKKICQKIGDNGGCTIFYGTDGILICDTYSRNARLLPPERMLELQAPEPYLNRILSDTGGHQSNWVEAV